MTVVAIDLGGTNMRAAPIGADDRPRGPVESGPAPATRAAFTDRVGSLLRRHGADRLGIAVPGLTSGTVCRWIPNLGYLDGLDLATQFPGVKIGLGNDAQLALLAEASAGAAKGRRDAVLLSIGTGIGSAVLAGGRIVRGSRGGACSFGWACADVSDPGHERHGWLERHASGTALDAVAASIGLPNNPALIAAARSGDERALEAVRPPMHMLGAALAGAVGLLDPEMIVITGGVAAGLDVLAPMIHAALGRQLPPHLREVVIRAGEFGPQAGLIGAAIAGRQGSDWGDIDG
jgi:predicted NBD/HSP70 family sugar kinase